MAIRLKKIPTLFCIIVFLLLATESTGFDLYAHSIMYYFHNTPVTHSYLLFDEILFPRYMLLSYIYEFFSMLGIPIGIVAVVLTCYPIYHIINHFDFNKGRLSLGNSLIIVFILLLSFFYSGLSLVLIWAVALFLTNKNVFLLGGVLHPVGFLIFLPIVVFKKKLMKFSLLALVVFLFFWLMMKIDFFTSAKVENVKYYIDVENMIDLLNIVIDRKFNEIVGMLIILGVSIIMKARIRKVFDKIYVPSHFVFLSACCVIFSFNTLFFIKDRHNLILDILYFDISETVHIAWFDFGEGKFSEGYRYQDIRFLRELENTR